MPYKLRTFECSGCGDLLERRAGADTKVRCINCAIARSVDNMVQLRRKVGPLYQRWVEGITAGVAREREWAAVASQLEDVDLTGDG